MAWEKKEGFILSNSRDPKKKQFYKKWLGGKNGLVNAIWSEMKIQDPVETKRMLDACPADMRLEEGVGLSKVTVAQGNPCDMHCDLNYGLTALLAVKHKNIDGEDYDSSSYKAGENHVIGGKVSPKSTSEWKQTLVLKGQARVRPKSTSEWKQT